MNYADYWTKHHPEAHHQSIRKEFLTPHIVIEFVTNRATAEDICIECSMSAHDRSYSD
jgi:hypothetical protein